jgi:hypothetical protein
VRALRIGIVGFDKVNALDLVGPAETFANARLPGATGKVVERYFGRDTAKQTAAYMGYQTSAWIT